MKLLLLIVLVLYSGTTFAQGVGIDCESFDWTSWLNGCSEEIARYSNTTLQPDSILIADGLPTLAPNVFRKETKRNTYETSDFMIEEGRVPGVCPPLSECTDSFRDNAETIAYCTSSTALAEAKRSLSIARVAEVPVKSVIRFLREQCFPLYDRNCEIRHLFKFRVFANSVIEHCFEQENILDGGVCSEACEQSFRGLANMARICVHRPSVLLTMTRFRPLIMRRREACEVENLSDCSSLLWRVGTLFTTCLKTRDTPAVCTDECRNARIASSRYINHCANENPGMLPNENRARIVEIDEACDLLRHGVIEVTEENEGKHLRTVTAHPIDLPGVTLADCVADVKSDTEKAPAMTCTFDGCQSGAKTTMEMIFDRVSDCTESDIDSPDTCASRDLIADGSGDIAIDMAKGTANADKETGRDGNGTEVVSSVQQVVFDDGCTINFRQRSASGTAYDESDNAVLGIGLETTLSMEQCVKKTNITSTRVVSVHVRCDGQLGSLMDDPDNSDYKMMTCGCHGVFRARTTGTCVTWEGVVRDIAYTLKVGTSNPEVEEKHGALTGNMQQVRIFAILEGIHNCEILEWDPSITIADDKLSTIDIPPFSPMAIVQPPSSVYKLSACLMIIMLMTMLLLL